MKMFLVTWSMLNKSVVFAESKEEVYRKYPGIINVEEWSIT